MYLIVIAWLYVTLLMALAEAFSSQGSVLGAIITFVFYGVVPMALVVYLGGSPLRRQALLREEQAQRQASQTSANKADAGGHAATAAQDNAISAVRKEP